MREKRSDISSSTLHLIRILRLGYKYKVSRR